MINTKRRVFLRNSSALAATGALTACGGGSGEEALGDQFAASVQSKESAKKVVAAPPRTPVSPAALIAGARFTVSSTQGSDAAPYSLGFAFKKGDVPSGRTVLADAGTLQVSVKNRWPDGSVKFAILSGQLNVPANGNVAVNLSSASDTAVAVSPIDTARLRSSGAVAEVSCGTFGAALFQGTDWNTPFTTWIAGPAMSSWVYRKPVGSDKHLVAWLEVRMWANGAIEMLPWIENGFLRVAAPSNKLATFGFTLNRSQRMSAVIDLKHHTRTPLINGTALSYWTTQDLGIAARQDTAYLQATELVPSYMSQLSSGTVLANLASSYQPLQAGNFKYDQDNMASSGYQDPIGLLPQHDVAHLIVNSVATFGAVVRNGFSAGRWAIHYRDENTNRPPRFSAYPTLNIGGSQGFKDNGGSSTNTYTPTPTGGNPPGWDVAHSPSVGYLAYLVTGRWYFMEEVQFATTANYLGNGDNIYLRTGSKGLVQTAPGAWQTRSCAWDWRARVQALCVTPDDDTALRAEFIASVEANIEHFHGRYVAQKNNPYGWIKPGEGYDGTIRLASPWQQDFATAAFGWSVSMGLPISSTASTKLGAFFAWKARSIVHRLGTKDGFWYINAAAYVMAISPSTTPDYDRGTGPWYATDAEVYAATYAVAPSWLGRTEGVLAAEYSSDNWGSAMWGNLMPAIAYAVQHGVPGAADGYNRVVNASNFSALTTTFNSRPVWSVKPARYVAPVAPIVPVAPVAPAEPEQVTPGDPAWMAGSALNQWIEIPGTAGAGGAAMASYSGFAFNEATNEILIAAAGGHGDGADNRVVSLKLTASAPVWRVRHASSTQYQRDVPYYPDGKPTSRHLYSSVHFIPEVNRLMLFGAYGMYGSGHFAPSVDSFNLDTNTWDPKGTWPDLPAGNNYAAVRVRGTGEVFTNSLSRWSPHSKAWTRPITSRTTEEVRFPIAHDSHRSQLFTLNFGDGQGYGAQKLHASRIPLSGSQQISVIFNGSAAVDSFLADKPTYSGMDYDPVNDRFMFYCGQGAGAGRVYVVKPNATNTWDLSILALAGTKRPPATPGDGVHNRFRYIPALRGFLLMPSVNSNLFFLRTSA